MAPNDSRHHLPVNSMLFESSVNLRSLLPANPTLVNIREAADTTITALPAPATTVAQNPTERKPSIWRQLVAKIKKALGGSKKEVATTEEKELDIGRPTDFQHHVTGGAEPLRTPMAAGRKWVAEEHEWEDVEDTGRFERE